MTQTVHEERSDHRRSAFRRALESGALQRVRPMLGSMSAGECANLLESLPNRERAIAWQLVDNTLEGEILARVNDEVRAGLIADTDNEELIALSTQLDLDDLADIIEDFPQAVAQRILESLDHQSRQRLESVLSYPEDSAGGLMNPDVLTVRPDVSLDVVQRYLRRRGSLPPETASLIVVDRHDRFQGMLPLTDLLLQPPHLPVSAVIDQQIGPIPVHTHKEDVARFFEEHDLISAPVVDAGHRLLGRITIDDVVDVIRERGEQSLLRSVGLTEEEDMFAPVLPSARRRAVWLGLNLLTAVLAAWVIGLFEATLSQVVALAILMPIVASMGGIAGSQTLTLVIRGMALGQIGRSNHHSLIRKELAVTALNGLLWSIAIAVLAGLWFQSMLIAIVIGAALMINLIVAAFAGVVIPLILRRADIDPALAGGVVLTTVTDVVGFSVFLGLGAAWLL